MVRHPMSPLCGSSSSIPCVVSVIMSTGGIRLPYLYLWLSISVKRRSHVCAFLTLLCGVFFCSLTTCSNGNFLGIGADYMSVAAVVVDQADPYGLLITNGEFTAFDGTYVCLCMALYGAAAVSLLTSSTSFCVQCCLCVTFN